MHINNNTIIAIVICENNNRYIVPFNITSKNVNSSSFELILAYPNPANISMAQIADKLEITVVQKIQISKDSRTILLKEQISTSAYIPPQFIGQVGQKVA